MLSFQFDLRPFGYVWMKVACATFFLVIFPFKDMNAKKNVNERLLWFDCKTSYYVMKIEELKLKWNGQNENEILSWNKTKMKKNAYNLENATTFHKQRARAQKNQSLILDQRQLVNVAITVLKILFAHLFCYFNGSLSLFSSYTSFHRWFTQERLAA